MKRFFKVFAIVLCLSMIAPASIPRFGVETVEAEDYDWDDDWDYDWDDEFDDYYDDYYDDYEEENDYTDIKKRYDTLSVSQSTNHTYPIVTLKNKKTNVYPIKVTKAAEYILGLTEETYGECSFLVEDSKGNSVYEKELSLTFDNWKKTISLSKGTYYIKILSKESIGFEYELFIKSKVMKDIRNEKIYSCHTKKLEPGLGKGSWTTSNKDIVSIESKNPKSSSTCTVRGKKTGSAVVTYKNSSGCVIEYKFTVSSKSSNVLEDAYFCMNSVGGLEPTIFIANNSGKKIKYIYVNVSFYNAVGDKLRNDIGGYTTSKLKITGYINIWENKQYDWDPVFYEYSARKMKVETMTIEYSDGSKKTINVNKKYSLQ